MHLEDYDPYTGDIILTISQDLESSGMSLADEKTYVYNEGFIAGILDKYTGKHYNVRKTEYSETKCLCRFGGAVMA